VPRAVLGQPPLLPHHVLLGVELPEDRVAEALGLDPEEQLDLLRREDREERRHVVAGEGIGHRPAGVAVDLEDVVQDEVRLLLREEFVTRLLERGQIFRWSPGILEAQNPGHDHVDFPAQFRVPLWVHHADLVRALEEHVLEEVGDPGVSGPLRGRPGPHRENAGGLGRARALQGKHLEPVIEHHLVHGDRKFPGGDGGRE